MFATKYINWTIVLFTLMLYSERNSRQVDVKTLPS